MSAVRRPRRTGAETGDARAPTPGERHTPDQMPRQPQRLMRSVLGPVDIAASRSAFEAYLIDVTTLVIPLISVHMGFGTRGGAEGVGRATTASVVFMIITVLVLDAIFPPLFLN